MASRARQSTAQPTQRRTAAELPTYQKPTFPLNPAAQRAFAQLNHSHNLKKLDETIQDAQVYLSNSAAAINDGLTEKERITKKRKEQASQDAEAGTSDELEQELEVARGKVDRMTQRMEESMRKMIDGRHSAQSISTALGSTADDARANASTQASTQAFQSQRPRRRPAGIEGDEDEDMADEDYQDFEPTDPAISTQNRPSPLETFKSKVEDSKTRYQNYSFTQRYANDNDYRNFRKVVHDAKYPDEEVPLAHHSEWFKEQDGGAPAPGVTTRAREAAEGEEEEDDIAVSRARISTKCPLTLMEFQTPLTSTKCPHSFEAAAITQMISGSNNRVNPRGERYVQCPVPGCSQTLTRNDLYSDAVLIRKIKRIQRSKELEGEEMEGQDGVNGHYGSATVIEDDDGDDVDDIVEDRASQRTQLKKEKTATPAPPPSSARRGRSAVVEVEGESDEDEVLDGDTMVE